MIMRELRRWAVFHFAFVSFYFLHFSTSFHCLSHKSRAKRSHFTFFKEAYPILMIMIIIISNRTDFLVCFFFGCLKTTMMAMAITDSFHTRKFNWRRCDEEWNKKCAYCLPDYHIFLFYFFSLLVGHNRLWYLLSANIIQNAKLLYYRSTLWRRRRRRHMTIKNPFFLAFFSFSVHSSVVYLCPYIRLAPNYAAALSTLIIVSSKYIYSLAL